MPKHGDSSAGGWAEPMSTAKVQQAEALFRSGALQQARVILTAALRAKPGDSYAMQLMATVLGRLGQVDASEHYADRALALGPNDAATWTRCAVAALLCRRTDRALRLAERAVELDAGRMDARETLIKVLMAAKRVVSAAALAQEGQRRHPRNEEFARLAYLLLAGIGRVDEGVVAARAGLAANPDDLALHSMLCSGLNYVWGASGAERLAAARSFGAMIERTREPPIGPGGLGRSMADTSGSSARRLRVGLLSGDLRKHAVACFAQAVIHHLDRAAFEVVCLSTAEREDDVSARLRAAADEWVSLGTAPPHQLHARLRTAKLDLLIDLHGHTDGHRLDALGHRVAPLQVTYCGYPATTGLPGMDVRLVDALTDPPGAPDGPQAWHTERLERIDGCFLAYSPPPDAPEPAWHEGRPPTFGSFNAMLKYNDRLIRLWTRLLHDNPGSRLLLKNGSLSGAEAKADLAARFEAAGAGTERIEMRGFEAASRHHLATYDEIDVALDTFPYHGTTTTCEALWMGVPVVTMAGEAHASRVGVSLLNAVGLGQLVAADEAGYAAIATALLHDAPRRRAWKAGLRAQVAGSMLCDGPGFGARFGAALRRAWDAASGRQGTTR